ncbi:MAG: VCBS repeat-containing protein, partial [Cyclobacteriaceae bacterium]|nr:VCBS repeat-containing protein [Cyclobacteriaceae bacterium]
MKRIIKVIFPRLVLVLLSACLLGFLVKVKRGYLLVSVFMGLGFLAKARRGYMLILVFLGNHLLGQNFSDTGFLFPSLSKSKASCWIDYNNDGYLDLFLSGQTSTGDIITDLYINNAGTGFTATGTLFTPVYNGSSIPKDFNADGLIDLLISGTDETGHIVTKLYINEAGMFIPRMTLESLTSGGIVSDDFNHDGREDILVYGIGLLNQKRTVMLEGTKNGFKEIASFIAPFSHGKAFTLDINNDGWQDIITMGISQYGIKATFQYLNQGNFVFEKSPSTLPPVSLSTVATGDVNGDALDDILLSGLGTMEDRITSLYTQSPPGQFQDQQIVLPQLINGKVDLLDYDGDGYLDLLVTGIDDATIYKTTLVRNLSDGTFAASPHPFPDVSLGTVLPGDFDGDGDTDILFTGFTYTGPVTTLYTNNASTLNAPPAGPANLHVMTSHDTAFFTWDPSADDLTPYTSLTYQLLVYQQDSLILSSNSIIQNGKRSIHGGGGQGHGTNFSLTSLKEGTYQWKVQAIDASNNASPFTTGPDFTICHVPNLGSDIFVCPFEEVALSNYDHGSKTWYSLLNGLISSNTDQITYTAHQDDTLVLEIIKPLGCIVYDTLVIHVQPLPEAVLTGKSILCEGDTSTLFTGDNWVGNSLYSFHQKKEYPSIRIYRYTAVANDTLILTTTDNNGCTNTDSLFLTVVPKPSISLPPDQSVCLGDTLTLSVPGSGEQISWYTKQGGLLSSGTNNFRMLVVQPVSIIAEGKNPAGCVT